MQHTPPASWSRWIRNRNTHSTLRTLPTCASSISIFESVLSSVGMDRTNWRLPILTTPKPLPRPCTVRRSGRKLVAGSSRAHRHSQSSQTSMSAVRRRAKFPSKRCAASGLHKVGPGEALTCSRLMACCKSSSLTGSALEPRRRCKHRIPRALEQGRAVRGWAPLQCLHAHRSTRAPVP